jgi:hypothetical protein
MNVEAVRLVKERQLAEHTVDSIDCVRAPWGYIGLH